MNEENKLIKNRNKNIKKHKKGKKNINLEVNIKKTYLKIRQSKINWISITIISAVIIILLGFFVLYLFKINNNNVTQPETTFNSIVSEKEIKFDIKLYKEENNNYENDNDQECNNLDPIFIFDRRLKDLPTIICHNGNSRHVCYKNDDSIFVAKNGVFCKMENIILDPSKWKDGGFIYKGPVDPSNRGCPILKKGFFNMKCEGEKNEIQGYDRIYNSYFEGWNYDYNEKEDLEELAPGKTIFFVSRNQDSPNLYHGGSEFVNAVSMIYLLDLNPQDIQVVFLESITLNDDPFYDLYKSLISR